MNVRELPDITVQKSSMFYSTLQWVGMENIAIPMAVEDNNGNAVLRDITIDVFVNIATPSAKGVHMSRLHQLLNRLHGKTVNKQNLDALLIQLADSQRGISSNAKLKIAFDLLLRKPSLVSGEYGYQKYPVKIGAELVDNRSTYYIEFDIPYSSTCPCFESLARQVYLEEIEKYFSHQVLSKESFVNWFQSKETLFATPHSQRSFAYLHLDIAQNAWPDLQTLIFQLEAELGTPVQTVVKRNDEKEFARINAENLMFCEDAARKVKQCLEQMDFVSGYSFKIEHQESLHAHNAVILQKSQA